MPSTVVSSMHYDRGTSTLRIVFASGMVYDYKDVPAKIYNEMKQSASKGTFLNQQIKKQYDYVRIYE